MQVDGVRGHHHALAVCHSVQRGGQQIRQRFAHARPRLNDDAPAVVDSVCHRLRHLRLFAALLKAIQRIGQRPVIGQQRPHKIGVYLADAFPCAQRGDVGAQSVPDLAYVKPVHAHSALRRHRRSGEPTARVGRNAVQQIAELPAGTLRQLLQRRKREGVKRVRLFQQRQEYVPRGAGVAQRAVRRCVFKPQIPRHILQRVAGHIGAQCICEVVGVNDRGGELNAVGAQKPDVEGGVLRYKRRGADERQERCGGALKRRRCVHIPLRYARQLADERRYAPLRVDESLECVQRSAVLELDRANLYYGVFGVVKPGGF